MPYVSEAERKRARWMTLAEAVAHVMEHDGCDRRAALRQIRKLLGDHHLGAAVWDGPNLPDLFDDGTVRFAGEEWPPVIFDGQPFWPRARISGAKVFDPHRQCWRVLLVRKDMMFHFWLLSAKPKRKRNVPRTDHRDADALLVATMEAMIVNGSARDATDAARAVVDAAPGRGTLDSKVSRLVRHYRDHAAARRTGRRGHS